MTTRVYKWTDAGAPQLTGSAGSVLAILNACLVDGYGSKSGAGWLKPFADGTHIGVFQQPTGHQRIFRVDDSEHGTARVLLYSSMTDIDTGLDMTPADSVFSLGTHIRKQETYSGASIDTARNKEWYLVASDKYNGFFMYVNFGDTSYNYTKGDAMYFGDIDSMYGDADVWCTVNGGAVQTTAKPRGLFNQYSSSFAGKEYCFIKSFDGNTNSPKIVISCDDYFSYSSRPVGGYDRYPYPYNGGLVIADILILSEDDNKVRGRIPCAKAPAHFAPLQDNQFDEFTDSEGNEYIIFDFYVGFYHGEIFVVTSEWD